MKVYTHLVIDMNTDEILHEESYNYEGPVAQCFGGGGGGGGGQPANTTNVQTIREAPEIEARRLGLMDQAAITASQPLSLPAFQIAQLSQAEKGAGTLAQQTGAGISSLQTAQQAASLTPSSARFQEYMNPYQKFVIDEINRQATLGKQEQAARAVQAGAFGGGREGVAIGEIERARLGRVGEALYGGFGQALGAFQQGQGLQAQTGIQAGQLIGQMQTQDIQNLMATGGTQRAVEQATLEAARQTGVQTATDPYQRLSFLSDIQRGVPSSQQTVAQGFAPQTSPLAQAVGTGIGAYAAFAPKS